MILCENPKGGTVKIGISLIEKSMIKPEATLVVVAHGSRVSTSNQEVLELTCSISETSPRLKVFAAFMELAEPSLVEVLEDCAMQTTEIVIVLPLFIGRKTRYK